MGSKLQRYLILGALTITPLWLTVLVARVILEAMADLSMPAVRRAIGALGERLPWLETVIEAPWFQWTTAVLATFLLLVALGWVASNVAGKRLVGWFDERVMRIPLLQRIYGASRKLLDSLNARPEGVKRVVLIEFPSQGMRAIGLVTRTLVDRKTGQPLAAVYVPTTPNPTSGYLEIVPREKLIETEWTMDEAMSFVISGGAVAPDTIDYE